MKLNFILNSKALSSVKSIISNLHSNYLVLIEYILTHLTEEQFDESKVWAERLKYALNTRKFIKSKTALNTRKFIKSKTVLSNKEILESNNNSATSMLRDLIKLNWEESIYK